MAANWNQDSNLTRYTSSIRLFISPDSPLLRQNPHRFLPVGSIYPPLVFTEAPPKVPRIETIAEKQRLAAAIAHECIKPEAQRHLDDDVKKFTEVVAAMRDSFKVISVRLTTVDLEELDGSQTNWANAWEGYRSDFESTIGTSRASASKIAVYAQEFEEDVLKSMNANITNDEKLNILKEHISKTEELQEESESITHGFRELTENLDKFKMSFSAWIETLEKCVSEELNELYKALAILREQVRSVKDQIAMFTAVGGETTATGALELIPTFTIFVLAGAFKFMAFDAATSYITKRHEELQGLEAKKSEKQSEKAEFSQTLDGIVAIQNEFDIKIEDNIQNVKLALGFLESIWRSVRADCIEIEEWLTTGAADTNKPPTLFAYAEKGNTIYRGLTDVLRLYVGGLAD